MMASSAEFPTFTGKDRDLIRQEFMDHSGSATSIHNGFRIRRWVAGPNKGQPKVPVTVGSMLERGLVMIVDPGTGLPQVLFTDAGFQALIEMADDPRAFRPAGRYISVLAEIDKLRGVLVEE